MSFGNDGFYSFFFYSSNRRWQLTVKETRSLWWPTQFTRHSARVTNHENTQCAMFDLPLTVLKSCRLSADNDGNGITSAHTLITWTSIVGAHRCSSIFFKRKPHPNFWHKLYTYIAELSLKCLNTVPCRIKYQQYTIFLHKIQKIFFNIFWLLYIKRIQF